MINDNIVTTRPMNGCSIQNMGNTIRYISSSFCSSSESTLMNRHILNTIKPTSVKMNNNPKIFSRVLHSNWESVNKL